MFLLTTVQHPSTVQTNELRNEAVWACCDHRYDESIPTRNNKHGSRRRLKCWSKRWKVTKMRKQMGEMVEMVGKGEEWRKIEKRKMVLL